MPGDVETGLHYLQRLPLYEKEKPYYINWPVFDTPEVEQTNLSHERFDGIQIHDIRGEEEKFKMDVQGFQLVKHKTSLSNDDFEDDTAVREKYYPEMAELAQETLGASLVYIFEHTVSPPSSALWLLRPG